mmetsp:Transcript_6568/g.16798  ORF Transcript_6568/g.16798 Transcript_6568/m.16798 type:complete len:216 (-) Transcript_6568:282-929(-)
MRQPANSTSLFVPKALHARGGYTYAESACTRRCYRYGEGDRPIRLPLLSWAAVAAGDVMMASARRKIFAAMCVGISFNMYRYAKWMPARHSERQVADLHRRGGMRAPEFLRSSGRRPDLGRFVFGKRPETPNLSDSCQNKSSTFALRTFSEAAVRVNVVRHDPQARAVIGPKELPRRIPSGDRYTTCLWSRRGGWQFSNNPLERRDELDSGTVSA